MESGRMEVMALEKTRKKCKIDWCDGETYNQPKKRGPPWNRASRMSSRPVCPTPGCGSDATLGLRGMTEED
jgi:hypothetical protein